MTHRSPPAGSPDEARRELARLRDVERPPNGSDGLLSRCLAITLAGLGADRVVLFLGHGRSMAPWGGVGPQGPLRPAELEAVSRTAVEGALRAGAPVTWDAADGSAANGSAADLGVLVARAVPLGSPAFGVLYVDFRHHARLLGAADDATLDEAAATLGAVAASLPAQPSASTVDVPEAAAPSLDALLALPGQRALRDGVLTALITDLPILITGETGTGKTLLARALAERLGRRPVVRAMLGASDDLNTLTSELFGHERGSFSGAVGRRRGLVEHADGGVLILDEVINLPQAAQPLLLDFVQFGTYRPLGYAGAEARRARVRIVAVTNGDLVRATREGRFRLDLFHRLAGVHLVAPPLRERRGDIAALALSLLANAAPGETWSLSLSSRQLLLSDALPWDGNTRELDALLRRALARARARTAPPGPIEPGDLDRVSEALPSLAPTRATSTETAEPMGDLASRWTTLQGERDALDRRELALIDEAMATHGGVVSQAARALGVARTTLSSRLSARGSSG